MATTPDYDRLRSDEVVTVWGAPTSGATGITDLATPTADELNNTGGTSQMLNFSPSLSWNDTDFGIQESETLNDPSYADAATYTEFGAKNYGGSQSYYLPNKWDDNSNNHSLVYDMTDTPRTRLDIAWRLDGETKTSEPAADGDFISTFRTQTDSEAAVWGQPDAHRRTIGFLSRGAAEFWTLVGAHTITVTTPPAFAAGSAGRIQATVQDRDYSSNLLFTSSDNSVIQVGRGGMFKVTGTTGGTATVTITDEAARTTLTVPVTIP